MKHAAKLVCAEGTLILVLFDYQQSTVNNVLCVFQIQMTELVCFSFSWSLILFRVTDMTLRLQQYNLQPFILGMGNQTNYS